MKENRKLLKEVIKGIKHDMTDEDVLNLLADSKVSTGKPPCGLCGKRCPRSRLPDHGHAASPAVSGGAVWRSVCTAFSESESEKNPGGPSDFL